LKKREFYRKGDIEALIIAYESIGCAIEGHWILIAGSESTMILR